MNVDYENLEDDVANGLFRESLREELLFGFRQIHDPANACRPPRTTPRRSPTSSIAAPPSR